MTGLARHYDLYVYDARGHAATKRIEAMTDRSATAQARRYLDGPDAAPGATRGELWAGITPGARRWVTTLTGKPEDGR